MKKLSDINDTDTGNALLCFSFLNPYTLKVNLYVLPDGYEYCIKGATILRKISICP